MARIASIPTPQTLASFDLMVWKGVEGVGSPVEEEVEGVGSPVQEDVESVGS